jgi:hypothetical protein
MVRKWEYMVVELPADPAQLDTELNRLGDTGWELIESQPLARETRLYILKRPAPGLPQC